MVVTFSWFIFTVCCSLICITQSYIVHKTWRRRTNLFSSLKPLLSDIPNSPPSFLLDGDFLNALPKITARHPRCAVYPTIDARYVDGCIPADLCDKIVEVVETGAVFQVRHSEERSDEVVVVVVAVSNPISLGRAHFEEQAQLFTTLVADGPNLLPP